MTNKYEALRNALSAGPTPGPWSWNTRNEIGPRIESDDQSDGMMDAVAYIDSQNAEPNRAYIAAANPATVSALLDEIDRLRAELQATQWLPIETAPKDELILVGPTKRMGICVAMNHSRDGWVTETVSEWANIYVPTVWMPLPPAPPQGETT